MDAGNTPNRPEHKTPTAGRSATTTSAISPYPQVDTASERSSTRNQSLEVLTPLDNPEGFAENPRGKGVYENASPGPPLGQGHLKEKPPRPKEFEKTYSQGLPTFSGTLSVSSAQPKWIPSWTSDSLRQSLIIRITSSRESSLRYWSLTYS
ncbi:unnamed protein product [Agarophyton chilense]